jgi:predicted RNase H-like nuclease (RuvC/YqgF family)
MVVNAASFDEMRERKERREKIEGHRQVAQDLRRDISRLSAEAVEKDQEIERLQKNYDLAASMVAELTNQETGEDRDRLSIEIERLRKELEDARAVRPARNLIDRAALA